jgi:peptidoglycan hydrolase CwlO-like protein
VVGELEMILGHLNGDLKEIESLDSKIMEILVKYTDKSDQMKEIESLGDEFKKAGQNFEQVRKLQENFLGKGSL